jgi:hypothetical protein
VLLKEKQPLSTTPALPAPASSSFAQPPAKPLVTHEATDATGCGEKIKAALHLVLDGTPYREAASEVGLARRVPRGEAPESARGAHEAASRPVPGLADLSGSELERRLVEDPESIGTKDLSVINGIALDKVANYEGWRHRSHDPAGLASAAIGRLSQLEGKLKLSVVVEREPAAEGPKPPALEVEKD